MPSNRGDKTSGTPVVAVSSPKADETPLVLSYNEILFMIGSTPVRPIACSQSSTLDSESHAGVRSDLFNGPLEETLITDFFIGSAQAEVLPCAIDEPVLERDAQLTSSADPEDNSDIPSRGLLTEAANGSTAGARLSAHHSIREVNLVVMTIAASHSSHGTWAAEAGELRAWPSSLLA
ncbi:uncharacterized protein LAESUDRAFT_759960 [Laetiporus sulphureus 93-53]|uniref:Uncharacterized protein n=1 Tax=Laetiporus sulphureus 93-53 TaxID=1314785 RepID=A0A165DVQ8_9APHY|nr:uncharacterized protein LAESUDRAFT_759960 [Laetiporus sulphureus 93-53]KZT05726.1 hypothetical protein LAESUDRAFT_759960 [Laetiporus sulphureus 93-53]